MKDEIKKFVQMVKDQGLYPDMPLVDYGSTEPEVFIGGKKYLMFCSNNYLGLATTTNVKLAAMEAIEQHGLGPCGSRLLAGNLSLLSELENLVANLVQKEAAIVFVTGYMANLGAIPAFVNPLFDDMPFKSDDSIIFSDEFNHATIIDGCRLSKVEKIIFKHKDIVDLEEKIKQTKKKNIFIVTDGIFSMDGDITPLPELVKIKNQYNATIMVDDAHGTGVLGKTGAGTAEYFGVSDETDIIMGTFNKGFGGMGGFIAADEDTIDYLRIAARSYVFSLALPAVIAAGVIAAIKEASKKPDLRNNLLKNAHYLRDNAKKLGFTVLGDGTAINPILVGDELKGVEFSRRLFENNIFAPCVRWPAVQKGKSRIRLVVMASHKKEHIDVLLNHLESIGRSLQIIS